MEAQIVAGCRRGDRAAQRALYELTNERIFRLLSRMLRNTEDAADVMQETYIRAFERINQFHGEADISTWVYRIAVNEALQFLRKTRRRDKLDDARPERPDIAVDQGQLQIDLGDALDRLPETERTLLILKYYQGLNYSEMAQILEKPAGTIASGLNRAREMLRTLLEGPEERQRASEEITGSRHPKD